MNAKTVKKIRRVLRSYDCNIGGTLYTEGPKNKRWVPGPELDEKGRPVPILFMYTGTVRLNPACGRFRYKQAKRAPAAFLTAEA